MMARRLTFSHNDPSITGPDIRVVFHLPPLEMWLLADDHLTHLF